MMIDDYQQKIELLMYFHRMYSNFVDCQLYHRENEGKKVIFEYKYEYLHRSERRFILKEFD
jgi:hypothetical protein